MVESHSAAELAQRVSQGVWPRPLVSSAFRSGLPGGARPLGDLQSPPMPVDSATPPPLPSPQAVTWDFRVLATGVVAVVAGMLLHADPGRNAGQFTHLLRDWALASIC